MPLEVLVDDVIRIFAIYPIPNSYRTLLKEIPTNHPYSEELDALSPNFVAEKVLLEKYMFTVKENAPVIDNLSKFKLVMMNITEGEANTVRSNNKRSHSAIDKPAGETEKYVSIVKRICTDACIDRLNHDSVAPIKLLQKFMDDGDKITILIRGRDRYNDANSYK